jgi:hypothetical protein
VPALPDATLSQPVLVDGTHPVIATTVSDHSDVTWSLAVNAIAMREGRIVAFGGQDLSYVEPGATLPCLVNMMGDLGRVTRSTRRLLCSRRHPRRKAAA